MNDNVSSNDKGKWLFLRPWEDLRKLEVLSPEREGDLLPYLERLEMYQREYIAGLRRVLKGADRSTVGRVSSDLCLLFDVYHGLFLGLEDVERFKSCRGG